MSFINLRLDAILNLIEFKFDEIYLIYLIEPAFIWHYFFFEFISNEKIFNLFVMMKNKISYQLKSIK